VCRVTPCGIRANFSERGIGKRLNPPIATLREENDSLLWTCTPYAPLDSGDCLRSTLSHLGNVCELMLAWGIFSRTRQPIAKERAMTREPLRTRPTIPSRRSGSSSTAAIRFGPGSDLMTSSPGLFPRISPAATSGVAGETCGKHGRQKLAAPPPSPHHNSTATVQALLPV